MLRYLLDEHISPRVAEQITEKQPGILIHSLQRWHSGKCLQMDDRELLRTAAQERLTFVTYDCRTIPSLLRELASSGVTHAGIVFVDERSIFPGRWILIAPWRADIAISLRSSLGAAGRFSWACFSCFTARIQLTWSQSNRVPARVRHYTYW